MNTHQLRHKTYSAIDRLAEHAIIRIAARLAGPLALAVLVSLGFQFDSMRQNQTKFEGQMRGLSEKVQLVFGTQEKRDERQDARMAALEAWIRGRTTQ